MFPKLFFVVCLFSLPAFLSAAPTEGPPDPTEGQVADVQYGSVASSVSTGDLNGDGAVDAADAGVLFDNCGNAPHGDPLADINN